MVATGVPARIFALSPNKTIAHNILSALPWNNTAQRHGGKDTILLLQSFGYMIPT